MGIPAQRLGEMIKEFKVPIKKGIYTRIEDHFFDEIDSEIKAYLLGYIIADGCIEDCSSRVLLGCHRNDLPILHLFKQFICPDNKITERGNKIKLSFKSNHMISVLKQKYHILPRKTYDINFEFPFELIEDKYQRHFVRGFIDGDGCIFYNRHPTYKRVTRISVTGLQLEFLIKIMEKLNVTQSTPYLHLDKNKVYIVGLGVRKEDEHVLYDFLYKDSEFFLERKKSKFINQYRGKLIE